MGRKTYKPKLADDLRRLRYECTPYIAEASRLLDGFTSAQGFHIPAAPSIECASEATVDPFLANMMTRPGNICAHALGGDPRTPNEPEVGQHLAPCCKRV